MVRVNNAESRGEAGGGMVEAGDYHWMIEDAVAETSDYGTSLKVVSSVLAGTNPAMVGRKHTEFFHLEGKAAKRLRCLLVACGVMTDEQWNAQDGLEFDETLLKGRQFCGRAKMEPYRGSKEENKGKSFPQLGFDIWSVFDARAANVPKDRDCLALLAPPAAGPVAGQLQQQPAAKQPPQPQQQPASPPQSKFGW